jgi:hypothetical protein
MAASMIIAIRVLRDGVAVREEIFRNLPVRIGRDPLSDLLLADPSVSRDHARIEMGQDGSLEIVDASGTNGLYAGPRRVRSEKIVGRLRARLGLVEIEIEEVSASATQPISLEDLHGLDQRRTPLTWAKYILITIASVNLESVLAPEFWSPWNSQASVGLVWQSASTLVGVLVVGAVMLGMLKAAGRKVRFADVLHHFAVYSWLRPLAVLVAMAAYYVLSDSAAGVLRVWLPAFATIAFFAGAAAIRRPGPNGAFLFAWVAAFLALEIGADLTASYAARRIGQPAVDHTMMSPLGGRSGPAVSWDDYAKAVEAAGTRSEQEARNAKP